MRHSLFIPALLLAAISSPFALHAQSASDLIEKGHDAFLSYDFDGARKLYASASKKLKKGDAELSAELSRRKEKLSLAESFLDRVARIEVIDSINVPRADFFRHYRLPQASGFLGDASDLPFPKSSEIDYVFTSENGDYKIWAEPDSTGNMRLREATRLTDGSWGEPSQVDDELSPEGDALYPFMCDDGVTLYFADNGDESMGGFDIMVATRDDEPGSFLQPRNVGMPFNSPFDDYLLAFDEVNDLGWWATDRNCIPGEVTIYIFRNPDTRQNYPADEENLISFAKLEDISATRGPDTDYSPLLKAIKELGAGSSTKKADFHLPMDGGRVYTSYDDFRNASARNLMRQYVSSNKSLEAAREKLATMRRRYHSNPSRALGQEIARMEKQVESERTQTAALLSEVYRSERSR